MAEFTPEGRDDYGDVTDPFVLKGILAGLEAEIRAAYGPAIVKLTQGEYDALSPPDEETIYIIVGD